MSSRRNILKRYGQVVKVLHLRCPRCQDGLNLSEGEAGPFKTGMVPYCGSCLKRGERVQYRARWYTSGPIDLHV